MNIPIRELSRLERAALEPHFLALGGDDRRLRFGAPFNDEAVRAYVERIDFERDAVFGGMTMRCTSSAAAHVARGDGHAELGVSVLPEAIAAAESAARFSRERTCVHATGACARCSCIA